MLIQQLFDTFYKKQAEYRKPTLPLPILFTHIPKCGGTSIDQAFHDNFRIVGIQANFETLRRASIALAGQGSLADFSDSATLLLLYIAQQGSTYLSGHFPINEKALSYLQSIKPFVSITLLREPYFRLQSNYIYRRVRLWMLGYEDTPSVENLGEETFLKNEREALLKFYDSKEGHFQLSLYANMFGKGDYAAAKSTLNCFDIVGVVEQVDLFTNKISKKLEHEFKVEHLNKIGDKPYQDQVKLLKLLFQDKLIETELKNRLYNENNLYKWVVENIIH